MSASVAHRQRMLDNLQRISDAGEGVARLLAAATVDALQAVWFAHCDDAQGEVRRVLQDAYYRRLAQLTGALVP